MNTEKILPIIKGIISGIISLEKLKSLPPTGGTISSRYCYSVWMRHLVLLNKNGTNAVPATIVEIGPGDSLGTGLAALLTGVERYHAIDVFKYWGIERNLKIFDELLILLTNRAPIPASEEFEKIKPGLENYEFPGDILTNERLQYSLSDERVKKIRDELINFENKQDHQWIHFYDSSFANVNIEKGSVDLVFSQSALEYVDDLAKLYKTMHDWLRPEGAMSHVIDCSGIGITKEWNGHWTYSDTEWKLYKGKRKFTINREPFSTYLKLNGQYNFETIMDKRYFKETVLSNTDFSKRYRNLDVEEYTTGSVYILSRKK